MMGWRVSETKVMLTNKMLNWLFLSSPFPLAFLVTCRFTLTSFRFSESAKVPQPHRNQRHDAAKNELAADSGPVTWPQLGTNWIPGEREKNKQTKIAGRLGDWLGDLATGWATKKMGMPPKGILLHPSPRTKHPLGHLTSSGNCLSGCAAWQALARHGSLVPAMRCL